MFIIEYDRIDWLNNQPIKLTEIIDKSYIVRFNLIIVTKTDCVEI